MTLKRRTLDHRTNDLQSELAREAAAHPVYTVEQLGPNRSLLPNGNLLCRNVPIARSGWLIYGPGEVPVKPGPNGVAYVERTNDSLFDEKCVGSFVGAAVTNDHPEVDVTPENFERYSSGFVLTVRRGSGADHDVLLADLVITRRKTIDDILAGKVEVSAGYDADYMDLGNGAGKQLNLIGNHVALVARGRCGPRCAIGDQEYEPPSTKERSNMTTRVKNVGASRRATIDEAGLAALRQRAADAVADLSAAESGESTDAADEGIHVHIHGDAQGAPGARTTDAATLDRITELETSLETLTDIVTTGFAALIAAKTGDGAPAAAAADEPDEDDTGTDEEKAAKKAAREAKKTKDAETRDSAALQTSYTELMSHAEVLVPGFKVPTFDAAATRATTVDRMCTSRKLCLSQFATADAAGAAMLKSLNGGQDLDIVSMDCAAAATLFTQAAGAKAALNNMQATQGAHRTGDALSGIPAGGKKPPTIAEINEANRKFWEGK